MKVGYVDTSCLVAIAFDEDGGRALARNLQTFDVVLSSLLLESELASVLAREDVTGAEALLAPITWILPTRRLTAEIERVVRLGYARGADLHHLACALYVAETPADVAFLTLDEGQRVLAEALGFSC